jgi:hypothetical protein
MEKSLSAAYLQGLAASNRLTDARGEVYRLLTVLPPHKRSAVIRIYNQLCSIQGALENQLKDVPVTVESEPGGNDGKEG